VTYKEMKDQVQRWLGLQDITDYDETAMIPLLLQQGTIDLLSRTRCTIRCIDVRVIPDVSEYMLDHSVLGLVDVEDGMRKARRNELVNPSFTMIRSDVLRIQPTPSEQGELQVWAVRRPSKMAVDVDSPSFDQFGAIPDEYHDAIVTYALWKAADYSDDSGSQQGERYRFLYEGQDGKGGRIAEIKRLVNKRGTARAPRRNVRLAPVSSSGTWTG
jgi:hypothetical protein